MDELSFGDQLNLYTAPSGAKPKQMHIVTRAGNGRVLRMVVYYGRYGGHLLLRLLYESVALIGGLVMVLRFRLAIIERHRHQTCAHTYIMYMPDPAVKRM